MLLDRITRGRPPGGRRVTICEAYRTDVELRRGEVVLTFEESRMLDGVPRCYCWELVLSRLEASELVGRLEEILTAG
jgi:hypothetical protein